MGDNTLRMIIYGQGAHVDPLACVEDISAQLAVRTIAGYPHSIWQIVEHMNYWMDYDLSKIAGENRPYPTKASESWVAGQTSISEENSSEAGWKASTRRFSSFLARLAEFAEADSTTLEKKIKNIGLPRADRDSTVHALLWQILAHNSYHTGQIAMLRRQFDAWPPERGGDTW
jgi:uncharacterized damage-inducible protein DinB